MGSVYLRIKWIENRVVDQRLSPDNPSPISVLIFLDKHPPRAWGYSSGRPLLVDHDSVEVNESSYVLAWRPPTRQGFLIELNRWNGLMPNIRAVYI